MGIGAVKRRAVFLDRDGVLNRAEVREGKPYPPGRVSAVQIEAEAPGCLQRLAAAGFALIVVTNQPDVARGTQTRAEVDAINALLAAHMPIDDFFVCDHDRGACDCRKPKPGLLTAAAEKHGLELTASYMVGDRFRDVGAGQAAGCAASLWIDRGYTHDPAPEPPFVRVLTLTEAADWILRHADYN